MPDVFRLPDLGEGLTESEVVAWLVAEGDSVELDQVLAEIETAKAMVQLPSPRAGVVERLFVPEGTTVAVGAPLVAFRTDEPAGAGDAPRPDAGDTAPSGDAPLPQDDVAPAAPPPTLVGYGAGAEGAGPGRRPRRFPAPAAPAVAPRSPADVEPGVGPEDVERIPVRGVRRRVATAMSAAAAVPQATVFLTVDVTPTVELLEGARTPAGRTPTMLAAVARAVCLAVPDHPEVNARWDEAAGEILRFRAVHLGIAVATPRGLLVPVLRAAQRSPLLELADRVHEAAGDARSDRTSPRELNGGTITISNVGVFGVESGTPILYDGQAAILALGAVARRPWAWRGEVALRSTVVLALTFDHRVLDGEGASRFLVDVGRVLTDPATAFLR
jgi:2-oxoisovalerate dehydrogenase E2 component (dihydrolipoyl transacylase)